MNPKKVKTVITIVQKDNLFLVMKRSPTRHSMPNKWQFVAGHIEKGETSSMTAEREAMEELRTRMARKIRTKKGMSIYGKRMHISEMPFGNIKQNLGFREFLLRSRQKADGEFKLISTIHNIKMIQRFIKKKLKIKGPPIDWIDRLIKIARKPAMATI